MQSGALGGRSGLFGSFLAGSHGSALVSSGGWDVYCLGTCGSEYCGSRGAFEFTTGIHFGIEVGGTLF